MLSTDLATPSQGKGIWQKMFGANGAYKYNLYGRIWLKSLQRYWKTARLLEGKKKKKKKKKKNALAPEM